MSDRTEQEREDGYELVNLGVVDELQAHVVSLEAERDTLREAGAKVADEFDALLNKQWAEGFSNAEVERLAEFRDRCILPLRAALAAEEENG